MLMCDYLVAGLKRCSKRCEWKKRASVHGDSSKGDGLSSKCKECAISRSSAWYGSNTARVSVRCATVFAANPPKGLPALNIVLTIQNGLARHIAQARVVILERGIRTILVATALANSRKREARTRDRVRVALLAADGQASRAMGRTVSAAGLS